MSNIWGSVDHLAEEKLKFDNHFEPSESFEPMNDRDEYLNKLESRLKKIKGSDREPSTKEILKCLNSAKEDFLSNFHSNECSTLDNQELDNPVDSHGLNPSKLLNDLERCVFPHRSSNNPEELEKLLKCDILSILTERSANMDKSDN